MKAIWAKLYLDEFALSDESLIKSQPGCFYKLNVFLLFNRPFFKNLTARTQDLQPGLIMLFSVSKKTPEWFVILSISNRIFSRGMCGLIGKVKICCVSCRYLVTCAMFSEILFSFRLFLLFVFFCLVLCHLLLLALSLFMYSVVLCCVISRFTVLVFCQSVKFTCRTVFKLIFFNDKNSRPERNIV